jgi:hypothetical protein
MSADRLDGVGIVACLNAHMRRIREAEEDGDNESAHRVEDLAHVDALRWIAANGECARTRKVARLALVSMSIDFDRWYA